ncbi:GNAT family N-acetyltransferase [Photobacterium galatheae]|uniref:GCN5 family acetyltransferase n=1 Tax=Photobacterium galatheae TaxID=1654360 RepID=A0A066RWP8_9GAMM|nr:GNAT family N-acetyltransferase [Photobacterium galatheae]KDM93531.1 GCN5 family acetyltransferase [Photobacterium galatheae]MCM0151355.1 GNAT family N-acetyltransferase [Photobacterium galatheae]
MNVHLLETHDCEKHSDLSSVLDVLLQLRPQYDRASLLAQIQTQQAQGYQVVYVKSGDQVLGVAGFVVTEKLAWGKAIYVDDLVTDQHHRSQGVGDCLIQWLKDYGQAQGCRQLHLDSGVQRFAAHRFYLRQGFNIASHHFSITDIESE